MAGRSLRLETGAQQVEGIDGRGAKRAAEAANQCRGEASWAGILLMAPVFSGVIASEGAFEELKGSKVDGRVREHANKPHRQASVEGDDAVVLPHLLGRLYDQPVAAQAARDSFALHSTRGHCQRQPNMQATDAGHTISRYPADIPRLYSIISDAYNGW